MGRLLPFALINQICNIVSYLIPLYQTNVLMQKGEEEYYENKHDFALVIPQGDIGQSGLPSTPLK
jgi:hypothetical protein